MKYEVTFAFSNFAASTIKKSFIAFRIPCSRWPETTTREPEP
jgi:hypothetical protein